MNFDMTEDQQAIQAALDQMVERHGELPVGDPAYVKINPAIERELAGGGFMDIARQEGLGALEAVLLVDAVGRIPYAVEAMASALVVPMLTDRELPGPVALAAAPAQGAIRFLGETGTLLVDAGDVVRVLDLSTVATVAAPSFYGYPFRALDGVDVGAAPVLEGASPETLRQYWRLGLAAEIAGAMDAAIATTVNYVKARKQFGQPLGAFQAIQHRLSECAVFQQGARMLVREAAWSGSPHAAALAAAYAQEAAARVVYDCQQFHGAIGLTLEYPLHYWTYRLRRLQGELGGPVGNATAAADMSWKADEVIGDPFEL